ncbi:hypothetical protein [Amycolatopsis sp. NPDC001319]|uniref:hypothetical protein n=1 Tax=unclassified Amycolatopsis TaxID=2618356 RepID=UPI003682F330
MKLVVSVAGLAKFLFWLIAVVAVVGFAAGAGGATAEHPASPGHSVTAQADPESATTQMDSLARRS